jgi:porin
VNSGLNLNVAFGLFPLTAYGGGLVLLPWEGAVFTVSALDPSGTATDNNLSDAFQDGVLVAAEGRVTIKPSGLVGHQLLGGGWSNKERVSLEQDPSNLARLLATQQFPRLADPGPVLTRFLERFFPGLLVPTQPLNRVGYTWTVYYNFDQYLWSPEGARTGHRLVLPLRRLRRRGEPHQIRLQRRDRRQGALVLAAMRQLWDRLGAHGTQ